MCLPQTFTAVQETFSRRDFFKLGACAAAAAALAPSVTRAQPRQLSYSTVQDLTHVFGTNGPVFPGFEPPSFTIHRTIADNGFYGNILTYWEHNGTHMDAPAHFAIGTSYVDQIPVTSLIAPLCVVDITAKVASNPDAEVTIDDLVAWEQRYGRLPSGAAVFMNSGWASRYGDPGAFLNADASGTPHFPGFGTDAVEFLLNERDAVGIGVDTLSLDFGAATVFSTHTTWLSANRWGLENVANLDSVPPSGATVVVGAPKVASGSGGPTRLIALY
jgi:kynurenine formamidase